MQSVSSCFSYLTNVVSGAGGDSHHPLVLEFSQLCLAHKELLVFIVMKRNKVKNNLCLHLGDIMFCRC